MEEEEKKNIEIKQDFKAHHINETNQSFNRYFHQWQYNSWTMSYTMYNVEDYNHLVDHNVKTIAGIYPYL